MIWVYFAIFFAACAAAGATGAMFQPGEWYKSLKKPSWTPPNWLFPLAWTTLYVCMSAAGARVAGLDGSGLALALWALQIALNTLWTPVFFGLRNIRGGMVVLVALWAAYPVTLVGATPLESAQQAALHTAYYGFRIGGKCALAEQLDRFKSLGLIRED